MKTHRSALACAMLTALVVPAAAQTAPGFAEGAKIFQAKCAVCHRADGSGQAGLAPPLTGYPARFASVDGGRRHLVLTALYGMFGEISVEGRKYNFKMPSFADLDDAALAQVLNHVVFDLAKAPASVAPLTAGQVAAERKTPLTGEAVRAQRAGVVQSLGL